MDSIVPTIWFVAAVHRRTGERKSGFLHCEGPVPLKHELDYFCPPDICSIVELRFCWVKKTKGSENGNKTSNSDS